MNVLISLILTIYFDLFFQCCLNEKKVNEKSEKPYVENYCFLRSLFSGSFHTYINKTVGTDPTGVPLTCL